MAKASRITPEPVWTLELTEKEARALSEYLNYLGSASEFRLANHDLYEIEGALEELLDGLKGS